MINYHINPAEKKLTFTYAEYLSMQPEVVKVSSYDHASTLIRIKFLKVISGKIREYINRRERELKYAGSYTPQQKHAIDRLSHVLDCYSEGSVSRLISRLVDCRTSFQVIEPSTVSEKRINYELKVRPILDWCAHYTNTYNEASLGRETARSSLYTSGQKKG
ncbi:hypothetical protein ACR79T_10060 [Sphingobacterium spiritivorum]|uniref:hypothetical protein n=1 Tax=Sphingobacterium spiritivorum TaxID=258 RepID=UPI003DA62B21